MNLLEAQNLARSLMNTHGLGHVPFEWNRGKRMLGQASFTGNRQARTWTLLKISLSRHWTEVLPESEVRDVILHEIAHAKVGPWEHHGPVWKREARALGHNATRCASPPAEAKAAIEATAPWVATCSAGHELKMHRAPGVIRSCNKCSPGRFNRAHVFGNWTHNGRAVPIERMPQKYQNSYYGVPRVRRPKAYTLEGMFTI